MSSPEKSNKFTWKRNKFTRMSNERMSKKSTCRSKLRFSCRTNWLTCYSTIWTAGYSSRAVTWFTFGGPWTTSTSGGPWIRLTSGGCGPWTRSTSVGPGCSSGKLRWVLPVSQCADGSLILVRSFPSLLGEEGIFIIMVNLVYILTPRILYSCCSAWAPEGREGRSQEARRASS